MSKAERGLLQCLSALRMYACTQEQTNSNTRTFAGVHGRQSNRKQRAFSHHGMSEVTLNTIFVPIILPSDAHLIEIQSQSRVGQSQREGLKQARETTGLTPRSSHNAHGTQAGLDAVNYGQQHGCVECILKCRPKTESFIFLML